MSIVNGYTGALHSCCRSFAHVVIQFNELRGPKDTVSLLSSPISDMIELHIDVIRKLWTNRHYNFDRKCKDFEC